MRVPAAVTVYMRYQRLDSTMFLRAATLFAFAVSPAVAGVEAVSVTKVMDDKALVVRANGDNYLIEKGVGCLSLWRFEGKSVLIKSPGLFLGVGSRLLIPDVGQECRIWDSEMVGSGSASATTRSPVAPRPSVLDADGGFSVLGRALQIVGFAGAQHDKLLDQTKEAFVRYMESKSHPRTDDAIMALAIDVLNQRPSPPDAQTVALALYRAVKGDSNTARSKGCIEGHWIESVLGDGTIIKLEDGSVWEVDAVDAINSMLWLPTESVLICGQTLLKSDIGEKVKVTRLK